MPLAYGMQFLAKHRTKKFGSFSNYQAIGNTRWRKRHELVSYCDHVFKTEQPGRAYPQKIKNEVAGVVAKWPEERLDEWIRWGIDEQTGFRIQEAIAEGKELWEEYEITEEQVKSLGLTWSIVCRFPHKDIRPKDLPPGYDVVITPSPHNDPNESPLPFRLEDPFGKQYFDSLFEALLTAERHALEYDRKIQDILGYERKAKESQACNPFGSI